MNGVGHDIGEGEAEFFHHIEDGREKSRGALNVQLFLLRWCGKDVERFQ